MNPARSCRPPSSRRRRRCCRRRNLRLTTMPSPQRDVHRARLAVGLVLAVGRAAVERQRVAVVAPLGALDLLVAAGRVRARARAAAALPPELDLAGGRAAVPGGQVAVVAQLGQHADAVATPGDAVAGLPGGVHEKPGSTVRQSAAQPSSPTVLPSSQASSWLRVPSPHTECCGAMMMSGVAKSNEGGVLGARRSRRYRLSRPSRWRPEA